MQTKTDNKQNEEKVTKLCPNCGCRFRVMFLKKGEDYQNLARELFCPFCATTFGSDIGF